MTKKLPTDDDLRDLGISAQAVGIRLLAMIDNIESRDLSEAAAACDRALNEIFRLRSQLRDLIHGGAR